MKREESLQIAISRYISLQFPNVIYTSESSGIKLTIGQAVKLKKMRSDDKLPDMMIFEPNGGYHGLVMELKTTQSGARLKDGTYSKGKDIQAQLQMLERFEEKGYKAVMAVGIDEAIETVNDYMEYSNYSIKYPNKCSCTST